MRKLITALVLVCLFSLPFGVILGWQFRGRREVAVKSVSESKMAFIKTLLLAYHEKNGVFPPSKYQPIANGPIHSWRVLIVKSMHSGFKYDYSQAWNSSNNMQYLSSGHAPGYFSAYHAAGHFMHERQGGIAHYLTIGEDDDWPAVRHSIPLNSTLVIRGNDRFLLVENPDSDILWTEPRY